MLNSLEIYVGLFLNSPIFLFLVEATGVIVKSFIFFCTLKQFLVTKNKQYILFLLSIIIFGSIITDASWILYILKNHLNIHIPFNLTIFTIRLAWIFCIIQYQGLSVLIESLSKKAKDLYFHQKLFLSLNILNIIIISIPILFCFLNLDFIEEFYNTYFNFFIRAIAIYNIMPVMAISLLFTLRNLYRNKIPLITKKQLNILLKTIIIPLMATEILQSCPTAFSLHSLLDVWVTNSYAVTSISTILMTYALYYCTRKMIGLRFLNMQNHVKAPIQMNFTDKFAAVFEQINNATNLYELSHLTHRLFQDAFNISTHCIHLYIRQSNHSDLEKNAQKTKTEEMVETILNSETTELHNYIEQTKILIYDEIDFTNFYEDKPETTKALRFLENINADIFVPIIRGNKIIAYIVVDRMSRPNQFYSNVERNEMLILAHYLSTIINLMQQRDIDTIIAREKELEQQLQRKHQENNQFKESFRSFIQNQQQSEIGFLYYKQCQFHFGNHIAEKLIGVNPNIQRGLEISKMLKKAARDAEKYATVRTEIAHDLNGNKLVLCAMPDTHHRKVIILVYYPEVSDILAKQLDNVKDPADWDYALYLETTKSGKLINKLIPGSGPQLLKYKIELLKIALCTKATLLKLPKQDLQATVDLIHHINLRDSLYRLNLSHPEQSVEIATKIFGINPLLCDQNKKPEEPILKKLNGGTLFIQNIHYLQPKTQKHVAELIHFGFYRAIRTDKKIKCDVRIICSCNQELEALVKEGKCIPELYNELQKTTVTMPSLLTLPENEFNDITTGFSEQSFNAQAYKNFLELTESERKKIIKKNPTSLQDIKKWVHHLLVTKSKKSPVYDETLFDPAYHITDPQLIEAARLGKHALRDPQILALLWNKFKNQNKIAIFLGVNRSSVNRRLKEFDIILEPSTEKKINKNDKESPKAKSVNKIGIS